MIKSIIFDCYGTLINTGSGSIEATEQILNKNNSLIDPCEFYNEWKKVHHELCNQEQFLREETVFRIGLEILYERYSIEGKPHEDVLNMLSKLGNRDVFPEVEEVITELSKKYLLVIGSNSDHQPLLSDIKRNNVEINKIYSSESLGTYKPKKDFYLRILNDLSLRAEETIYVGDSQIDDIKGPNEVGISSVWINRKEESKHEGIPEPIMECLDLKGLLRLI